MQPALFSAQAQGIAISATSTASTSVALPSKGNSIRLVNEGPNNCYVSIGTGTQTAVLPGSSALATCVCVLVGEDATFSIPNTTVLNISAICRASQTATLLAYTGEGA